MINIFKNLYKNIFNSLQLLYRTARGLDHKILSEYIIKINQKHDIDSIIYQASQCLYDILDYRFFAFAVYDREYNGGVDIWMDPKTDNVAIMNFIQKDFSLQDIYCNVRCFSDTVQGKNQDLSNIDFTDIITYKVMDTQTRALLYLLPRRTMLPYHNELLDIIIKIIATFLSNYINMKKLENAALIDPLTHCYNRRALDGYMDRDMANVERYGSNLAVVMFDIDHFKKVNDTHGHKAGDAVLRAVSKSVLSAIRKGDYLARYGGEEFLLVLPETDFIKALELAERLRMIIENLKINLGNQNIRITASFGVAACKQGMDKNKLIQRADEMLYKAKRYGRNITKPDVRVYQNIFEASYSQP